METIKLSESNDSVGNIEELSPKEKAQLRMTYWVLGGVSIIFLLSGSAYIFTNGIGIDLDLKSLAILILWRPLNPRLEPFLARPLLLPRVFLPAP